MKKTALVLCLASASFYSVADSSAYIGLNVGQSTFADQKDVGAGAYLGANLLSFLAVELGFQGHGKHEDVYIPEEI